MSSRRCVRGDLQQCVVFLLLVRPKGNAVNVLRLGGKLEVNKRHVLLAAKAKVKHQRLQQRLSASLAASQGPRNDGVENLGLLDTARDVEELEQGVDILDAVDTGRGSESTSDDNTHKRTHT